MEKVGLILLTLLLGVGCATPQRPYLTIFETPFPNVTAAWRLVVDYFPEEAQYVTALKFAETADLDLGWVYYTREPTVIYISIMHARTGSIGSIGSTLAHEMRHVTQAREDRLLGFHTTPKDARQREARTIEVLFFLRCTEREEC